MFVSTNSHHRLTNNLANDTGEKGGRVSDRRQWVETPKNNSRHRSLLIFIYPSAQSANLMRGKLTFRMTFQCKFSLWISGPILKKTAPDMKTLLTGVKTPHQTWWHAIITDNTPRRWAHKASFQRLFVMATSDLNIQVQRGCLHLFRTSFLLIPILPR